ncbi:MAG: rod shape-determining protein RodA [Flavobacteriaceae bacterium]|nr:rod shape-determining protein RodA [Flavobacteriaceae bacterium]
MRSRKTNVFYGIDWVLVLMYLSLIFVGWLNIYSVTVTDEDLSLLNLTTGYGKQLLWILLCFPVIVLVLMLDVKFYEKFGAIIYLVALLSLVGLFLFGKNINGATSWYALGSFTLQPSEFMKAATALAMAKLVSDKQFNLKSPRRQLQAIFILFLPAILITLQPDPGSALVYISFFLVLYREGLPMYYISFGATAVLLFLLTLYFGAISIALILLLIFIILLIYLSIKRQNLLKRGWPAMSILFTVTILYVLGCNLVYNNVFQQRHRDRFDILLGLSEDTSSIGYNTNQAIKTIASGGFEGRGFLQGERTQGHFVPEQDTDYIFTTVGEEWGFIGTTFVIVLFIAFLLRIITLADRQKMRFSRIYGYSIAAIFFFHFAINIGMVIGLLPTIGIPLPFFSYGGSGLWGFTLLLFIFIRLDANRTYEW